MVMRINLLGLTRPDLNQILGLVVTAVLLDLIVLYESRRDADAQRRPQRVSSPTRDTFVLGLGFLLGVVLVEWRTCHSRRPDSQIVALPGAAFFMMTGMHAFHVFTGLDPPRYCLDQWQAWLIR